MILNEDYFKDLEIEDEDIIEDDTLDVEYPQYGALTVEELHKLPEQYNHSIVIEIKNLDKSRRGTTFIQTTLIPKLFKKLDDIFDMYGIEDSQYVLTSVMEKYCDTVVKFGDYQLFCEEYHKDDFINDTYEQFFIRASVNYPQFSYKRVFRFIYTLIPNLYRMDRRICFMGFYPSANDYVTTLYFYFQRTPNDIRFEYYDDIIKNMGQGMFLCDEEYFTSDYYKKGFYYAIIRHFFRDKVKVPYELIDRDVPLKPIRPR